MKTRQVILTTILFAAAFSLKAQTYNFSFDGKDKSAIRITSTDVFTNAKGYGYDFTSQAPVSDGKPFFFSVNVPDGNYKVTVSIGSKKSAASTTVRAESRRLFYENIITKKGEMRQLTFVVNKRNTLIGTSDRVKIKDRERGKLNWDDRLTIEINGDAPACSSIRIEPAASDVTTLWLCGNSTVVDQDYEPWASWGQMIPRWFDDGVAIANYAESGETAASFIGENRLKKILTLMKHGDYVFVEFGHNDQKQKGPGIGAFYSFATTLKQFIDEVRQRGGNIIFVTPTQRRSFNHKEKIEETHGDYPDAMREVARREGVQVIEVHDMTRTFFETLGVEGSKNALVHYAAHTFPSQNAALADNTHFNPYGAYEVAKMVVEGIRELNLPFASHIRSDFRGFDPSRPDDFDSFRWNNSPFFDSLKPDGN